jgi:uncharacterized protein (DUF1810 family)
VSLDRFIDAQDRPHGGYADALTEIRSGAKTGHWIWYVFPQLYGLGTSSQSRAYGVRGVAEAIDYLNDPTLRSRLLEISMAVCDQLRQDVSLETVMGSSIDALKLVSSLTLFGGVARQLACEDPSSEFDALASVSAEVCERAARAGYPPCERTRAVLTSEPSS